MIELRYPNYIDCALIDEVRPELDLARLETASVRIDAITASILLERSAPKEYR